jgi:hypothetical protein
MYGAANVVAVLRHAQGFDDNVFVCSAKHNLFGHVQKIG